MTARLLGIAAREWAVFDGESVTDPLLLPADRFFNRVYWWAIRNAQEQSDIDRFDRKLWMPPKGRAAAPGSPWSAEAETAAFGELAAAFGVQKKKPGAMREGAEPPPGKPAS